MRFRLVPKLSILDDLECQYALYVRKDASFGANDKKLNEP